MEYFHPSIFYAESKRPIVLDIYVPIYNLAFEYKGGQHYYTHYLFGSASLQQKRDTEKRAACKQVR